MPRRRKPRCPICKGTLTVCPEGRIEQKARPWLSNRIPFVSCNKCEAIYDGTGWQGLGKGRHKLYPTLTRTKRVRKLLKPQVSAIVNRLRERANQLAKVNL